MVPSNGTGVYSTHLIKPRLCTITNVLWRGTVAVEPAHAGDHICMQFGRSISPAHPFFSRLPE